MKKDEFGRLLKELGLGRELSRRLGDSYVLILDCSQEFIEVAWCGDIISIYDKDDCRGVGKGHIQYEVRLNGERVHGTEVCRRFGIDWDEDSAPRYLWRKLRKLASGSSA